MMHVCIPMASQSWGAVSMDLSLQDLENGAQRICGLLRASRLVHHESFFGINN